MFSCHRVTTLCPRLRFLLLCCRTITCTPGKDYKWLFQHTSLHRYHNEETCPEKYYAAIAEVHVDRKRLQKMVQQISNAAAGGGGSGSNLSLVHTAINVSTTQCTIQPHPVTVAFSTSKFYRLRGAAARTTARTSCTYALMCIGPEY